MTFQEFYNNTMLVMESGRFDPEVPNSVYISRMIRKQVEDIVKKINEISRIKIDKTMKLLKTGSLSFVHDDEDASNILDNGIVAHFTTNLAVPIEGDEGKTEKNVEIRVVACTSDFMEKIAGDAVPGLSISRKESFQRNDWPDSFRNSFMPTIVLTMFGHGLDENLRSELLNAMINDPNSLVARTKDDVLKIRDDVIRNGMDNGQHSFFTDREARIAARKAAKFIFQPTDTLTVSHEIMHLIDQMEDSNRNLMDRGSWPRRRRFVMPKRMTALLMKDERTPEEENEYRKLSYEYDKKKKKWEDDIENTIDRMYWKRPGEVNARIEGFISDQIEKARKNGYDTITLKSMMDDLKETMTTKGVTEHQRRRIFSMLPEILKHIQSEVSTSSKDLEERARREAEAEMVREEASEKARRWQNYNSIFGK